MVALKQWNWANKAIKSGSRKETRWTTKFNGSCNGHLWAENVAENFEKFVPVTAPSVKTLRDSYQDLGFSYKILLPVEFLDKTLENLTSSKKFWISWQKSCKFLDFLVRVLSRFLPRNPRKSKILTKSPRVFRLGLPLQVQQLTTDQFWGRVRSQCPRSWTGRPCWLGQSGWPWSGSRWQRARPPLSGWTRRSSPKRHTGPVQRRSCLPPATNAIQNKSTFFKTSRERPKSAPYLRLKNNKSTSKCQVFSSTVPVWGKIEKNSDFFEIFLKSDFFWKIRFFEKILVMAGLEPMSFCLSDLEKAVVAKWQWSSVTQFSVSAGLVPTYKIYKICQFVGLKKSHYYSLRFSSKSAD